MEKKVYQANKSSSFSFRKTFTILGLVIFLIIITSFVVVKISPQTAQFFPAIMIFIFFFAFFLKITKKVDVWVEGNSLIIEKKYGDKKREQISLVSGLELKTENEMKTSGGSASKFTYYLYFTFNNEKKFSLQFNKKIDRTNLCKEIIGVSNIIDTSDLDLSEEDNNVPSFSDVVSIFKQAKTKTSGDIIKQSTSESEVEKSGYGQQTPQIPTKPTSHAVLKIPELLRAVFVILLVVVVVYYYIVYIK